MGSQIRNCCGHGSGSDPSSKGLVRPWSGVKWWHSPLTRQSIKRGHAAPTRAQHPQQGAKSSYAVKSESECNLQQKVQILRVKKETASSKLPENSTLTDLKKRGQEIHGFVPSLSTSHIRQDGKKGDANIHTLVYICTLRPLSASFCS